MITVAARLSETWHASVDYTAPRIAYLHTCLDFKGSTLRILSETRVHSLAHFTTLCLQSVSIPRGVRKSSVLLCHELPGREFFICSLCVAASSVIRNSDIVTLEHQSVT